MCQCLDENCGKKFDFSKKTRRNHPESKQRMVTIEQRESLRKLLNDFKIEMLEQRKAVHQVSLPNLFFEFTETQIKQVMKNISKIFTLKDLESYVEIWRRSHGHKILELIQSVFEDIDDAELLKGPLEDEQQLVDVGYLNNTDLQSVLTESQVDYSLTMFDESGFSSKRTFDEED